MLKDKKIHDNMKMSDSKIYNKTELLVELVVDNFELYG